MLKILVLLTAFASAVTLHSHFYRKDYTFFEEFDAFYKLHYHNDGASWNDAFMACDDEGAQLFYPKIEGEWTVVKNLTSLLFEAPNTTDVLVGIHDEIGLGEFVTVNGQVTPTPIIDDRPIQEGQNCIIMDMDTGDYKTDTCISNLTVKRVFVCKKVDEKPCRTIDLGYKYAKETKKCYKINERKRSWQEAWHTCYMEGGMLVNVESNTEAEVIHKIMKYEDKDYFSGFRRIFPGSDLFTVKGKKLDETGFQRWRDRQNEDKHNCGAIYYSSYNNLLYIRTRDCNFTLPFICEMPATG